MCVGGCVCGVCGVCVCGVPPTHLPGLPGRVEDSV